MLTISIRLPFPHSTPAPTISWPVNGGSSIRDTLRKMCAGRCRTSSSGRCRGQDDFSQSFRPARVNIDTIDGAHASTARQMHPFETSSGHCTLNDRQHRSTSNCHHHHYHHRNTHTMPFFALKLANRIDWAQYVRWHDDCVKGYRIKWRWCWRLMHATRIGWSFRVSQPCQTMLSYTIAVDKQKSKCRSKNQTIMCGLCIENSTGPKTACIKSYK